MAKLRQEINLLTANLSAATGASATSNERAQLNTAVLSGSVTYYFEIVASSSVSLAFDVSLRREGTSTDDVTINVPTLTTTPTLFRSASFTPPAGATTYQVFISAAVGATKNVKAARIVILQDDTPLVGTETQIEIGAQQSFTATTQTALTNPKYWLYTSANWVGKMTAYFEVVWTSNSTKITATAQLQVSDGTGDNFTGWTAVGSDLTTTSATVIRSRSAAVTLTAGRNYRITFKTSNSKSAINVYAAKIVIVQSEAFSDFSNNSENIWGGTAGEIQQATAQSFVLSQASTPTAIKLGLHKSGSPTDNLTIDIVSSLGGSSLASGSIANSSLTTTLVTYTITFDTTSQLSAETTYYIQLTRTGSRDTNNFPLVGYALSNIYGSGSKWDRDNNIWTEASTEDFSMFELVGIVGITKLEPQYLLANTTFGAGTALQTYLTKWDDTEWSSVTNTYKFAADAANGSTSVVELDTAGGTQVTGSVVTSPDNQGISSAMTMPTAQNLDCKATTNNGDVYGTRILVQCVVTAAFMPPKPLIVSQAVNRAATY